MKPGQDVRNYRRKKIVMLALARIGLKREGCIIRRNGLLPKTRKEKLLKMAVKYIYKQIYNIYIKKN